MIGQVDPNKLDQANLLEMYKYLAFKVDDDRELKFFAKHELRNLAEKYVSLHPGQRPERDFFFQEYEEIESFVNANLNTNEQKIKVFDSFHGNDFEREMSDEDKIEFIERTYYKKQTKITDFFKKHDPEMAKKSYEEQERAYLKLESQIKKAQGGTPEQKANLMRSFPLSARKQFLSQYKLPIERSEMNSNLANQVYESLKKKYELPLISADLTAKTKELFPHLEEKGLSDEEIYKIGRAIESLQALSHHTGESRIPAIFEQVKNSKLIQHLEDEDAFEERTNDFYREILIDDKENQKFSGEKALAILTLSNFAAQAEMLTAPLVRTQIETVLHNKVAPIVTKAINDQIEMFDVDAYADKYTALAMSNLDIRVQDEIDMSKHRKTWERVKNDKGETVNPDVELIPDKINEIKALMKSVNSIGDLRSARKKVKALNELIQNNLLDQISPQNRNHELLNKIIEFEKGIEEINDLMDEQVAKIKEARYSEFPRRDKRALDKDVDNVLYGSGFTSGVRNHTNEVMGKLMRARMLISKNISRASGTLNAMAKVKLYDDLNKGMDLSLTIKELCPEKDISKIPDDQQIPDHDVKMSLSVDAVNKLMYQRWKNGDLDFCLVENELKTCNSISVLGTGTRCKFEKAPRMVFKKPGQHALKFPELDCDVEGNIPLLFNSEKVEGEIEVMPEILEDGRIQFATKTNFELNTNLSKFYNPIATVSSLMKNGLVFPVADLLGVGFEESINNKIDSTVNKEGKFNLPRMKFKHHRATENAFILYADFDEQKEPSGPTLD
jgi:hypothetical protein